jgi:hypothetical protein
MRVALEQYPPSGYGRKKFIAFREAELAGNQDMRSANETYGGFLSLLKWGTIVSIVTAAIVVLIIA